MEVTENEMWFGDLKCEGRVGSVKIWKSELWVLGAE